MSAEGGQGRGPRGAGRQGGGQGSGRQAGGQGGGQGAGRHGAGRPRTGRSGGGQKDAAASTRPRPDARSVALAVMTAVRERAAYANLQLPAELRRAGLDTRDAALATELTYGTLRAQGLLDRIIAEAAGRPVEEIDPPVLDLVRLGAYQLLYTRIGAHAAVDTSVEAARTADLGRAGAFVNAVLRKVAVQDLDAWVAIL
ncbi:transcription antitermination factor NusB, partial [Dietzia sp. UBA5065]|uniref:transcription antitermination factor NusB n=1 Tax=Dietzia sp. UBA5065 TaxID=1946422 RepID=UPI0025B8FE61